MGANVLISVNHFFVSPQLHGGQQKLYTISSLKKNKTKTKMSIVEFEPSSLIKSESDPVTIRPPIHYKIDVLLKYKLHNKNVKIREKKGEQQQQK